MSTLIDQARRAANRAQVVRRTATVGLEVRAAGADGAIPVQGHAALYDVRSQPLQDLWEGRFIEVIAPGAFTKTLRDGGDVTFNIDHNDTYILARTAAGNLTLSDDGDGLLIDARMAPTTYARDLATNMQAGNISQMSFAFQAVKDDWDETDEGTPIRTLREVNLYDVAAVSTPAYAETDIGLRSREARSFLHAFGLLDLPEEQRGQLVRALTTSTTPDEALLPALRAAHTALAELVSRAEPVSKGSRDFGTAARQYRLGAVKYDLPVHLAGVA